MEYGGADSITIEKWSLIKKNRYAVSGYPPIRMPVLLGINR